MMDSSVVKARKAHDCHACEEGVCAGEKYVRTVCTSDDPDHPFEYYKHCLRCWSVLRAVRRERPGDAIAWALDCGEDWKDAIGDLPDEIAALAFLTRAEVQALPVVGVDSSAWARA